MASWKSYRDSIRKKYIICDGDQTLYESVINPVSDKMLNVIQGLIDSGYGFGVISGTHVNEISRLIRSSEIGREHHILGNSGGSYYINDGKEMHKVYEEELGRGDKLKIFNALKALIKKYDINPSTNEEDQMQDRGSQITLSALGRNAPVKKKEMFDPDGSKRKEYVKFLRQHLPEDKYGIRIGGTPSIDITLKEIDKGYGIRKFAEYNKISLESIIFFGDKLMPGGNDYSVKELDGVNCVSVNGVKDALEKLTKLLSR